MHRQAPLHTCAECGVKMPMEDGHDSCVHCLGVDCAQTACSDPASCMNCFILPGKVREARLLACSRKRPAVEPQLSYGKQPRLSKSCVQPPSPATPKTAHTEDPLLGSSSMNYHCPSQDTGSGNGSPLSMGSDTGDIDILGSGSENEEPTEVRVDVEPEGPSPHCQAIIARAAQALGVAIPSEPARAPSLFDDSTSQTSQGYVPLLADLEEIMTREFAKPSDSHRWSGLCRRLARVHERERIGCGPIPPMDQALGPFLSPSKSVLGKASCPSRNTKAMDAMLAKLHGALAVQGQLVNTGAILTLYQKHLAGRLGEEGADAAAVAAELQQVSSLSVKLVKEQAVAMGRAMASFWVARRHLWLSQSQLGGEDRNCLLQLPIMPSAMFGPNAIDMLKQAQEARRCAREVSTILRQSRGGSYGRTPRGAPPRTHSVAPDDLRVQLDASRRGRTRRDRQSSKNRGQGPQKPQPRP